MEKYYLIGSSLLVGVCTIGPLAAGQFKGLHDDLCDDLRVWWLVGTQSFWIFLMASSELVCFVILMSYMLRHRVRLRHCVLSVFETDNDKHRGP
jgi:hypothetical protein